MIRCVRLWNGPDGHSHFEEGVIGLEAGQRGDQGLVTQLMPSKQIDPLSETPVVLVVDDDPSLREALDRLFRSVDLESRLFSSVAELLPHKFPDVPCCLVLDIRLPGLSGLDFQTQLANSNIRVPIIMMTGHGDIPMSVRAMKEEPSIS
jgi:ActR/RegA family two-component response regulator